MQFIVLIFSHSVLFFYLVFMCSLSGVVGDGVQAVFAHGFLSTEKR